MEVTKHEIKCWPRFFGPLKRGLKTFEIRKNDRGYKAGDYLVIKEYDPEKQEFSGAQVSFHVPYLTDYGQQPGYVVMSLKPVNGAMLNPQRIYDDPAGGWD